MEKSILDDFTHLEVCPLETAATMTEAVQKEALARRGINFEAAALLPKTYARFRDGPVEKAAYQKGDELLFWLSQLKYRCDTDDYAKHYDLYRKFKADWRSDVWLDDGKRRARGLKPLDLEDPNTPVTVM